MHSRMLRASVTTAVVLPLAAGSHIAGGGVLPGPVVLVALTALTQLLVTIGARRAFSLPALLAILGGGQFVLHHAFSITTTAACAAVPGGHFGAQSPGCMQAVTGHEHSTLATAAPDGSLMILAHAGAVLATALMLQRGEAALLATLAWLAPLLRLPAAVVLFPAARRRDFPQVARCPLAIIFLDARPLRGPPTATTL